MDRLSIRLIILTSSFELDYFVYYLLNGIHLVSIMIHKILLFFPTFLDKIDSIYLGVGPYSRKLLRAIPAKFTTPGGDGIFKKF